MKWIERCDASRLRPLVDDMALKCHVRESYRLLRYNGLIEEE